MIVRQKRNRKIIGKIKISACVFVFAILAGGCAKKAENINLTAGMELVEQYDFQGAMEKFEQALLDKEDMELSYRGQGIALFHLFQFSSPYFTS